MDRRTTTRRWITRSLALLLPLLVLGSCAVAPETEAAAGGPRFELASVGGERVSSSAFDGKVLVMDFWATWCTPCVAQARILEPLHRDFEARGVEFVAISLGEDQETVEAYVERNPFPYQVLYDPLDELTDKLGIYALPTVVIVDASGRIAYQQPGISDGEVLRRVLEETLAG